MLQVDTEDGALVPAATAAVVVSLTENAGPDLLFSEQEVRLMGETFAHEVLHYTGIFQRSVGPQHLSG